MRLKFAWRRFFQYYGLTLILLALGCAFAFYYPMTGLTAFKSFERIDFFLLVRDEIDDDYLPSFVDGEEVLAVAVNAYSPTSSHLTDIYEAMGREADILLLRDIDLEDAEQYVNQIAAPIEADLAFGLPTYDYENETYGICVYDGKDEEFNSVHSFVDWLDFSYEGKMYLCLGANSDNGAPYVEGAYNDAATRAIKKIVEDWI